MPLNWDLLLFEHKEDSVFWGSKNSFTLRM